MISFKIISYSKDKNLTIHRKDKKHTSTLI